MQWLLHQTSLIDWAVVGTLLVAILTVLSKWLLPAIMKLVKNGNGNGNGKEDFRELRGILQRLAEVQSQLVQLLIGRTELFERQEKVLDSVEQQLEELKFHLLEHRRMIEEPHRKGIQE